jgi:hypothetical protein
MDFCIHHSTDQEAVGVGLFPAACTVLVAAIKKGLPAPWIKHVCIIVLS